MKKHRTKRASRKAEKQQRGAPKQMSLVGLLADAKLALRELVVDTGLKVFQALLEQDRSELCGTRYTAQEDRTAYRHGYCRGEVVFGGRKVTVPRPRVRSADKKTEVPLETWEAMTCEDPLADRVLEQMLVGVSTRKYERSLEPVDPSFESHTTSRSSVSRRFVAKTQKQVDEFLSRSLEDLDLPVIMIDGKQFGEHVLLIALGFDREGRKHPLGVVEGTTESTEVCRSLLRSLVERGLTVERARLFVIDGAKGLRKAIRTVFGQWALIQRCQVHKSRNVREHLPEKLRAWVRATMDKAYAAKTVDSARKRLLNLAQKLEGEHPSAARSLREGLDDTLTVIDLGLTGWLLKAFRSTNAIENLNSTLQRVARNVKRWRGGQMAQRWAVTSLIEAHKRFKRIKGYREMPALLTALTALEAQLRAPEACGRAA